MANQKNVKVGISIGDINGIGLEVVLKSLENRGLLETITPVLFASTKVIDFYVKRSNSDLQMNSVKTVEEVIEGKVNVVEVWDEEVSIVPGEKTDEGGKYALASLVAAAEAVKKGTVEVLVTAPINKENIQSDSFKFKGHTEYLEAVWEGESLMFLVHENIRAGLVTNHLSIKEVVEAVTEEAIMRKAIIINESLVKDFGLQRPKIAILGLNPHAGDGGLIGKEESEIIIPAIEKLGRKKILAFGPYPADSFFRPDNLAKFDAVLGMYHDQTLGPFKALTFNEGVNFTAGLPFVRTSPDHGVAYDIAGKGLANAQSFGIALDTAVEIYRHRTALAELQANHLEITPEVRVRRKK